MVFLFSYKRISVKEKQFLPDFSMYLEMNRTTQPYNISGDNRWCVNDSGEVVSFLNMIGSSF